MNLRSKVDTYDDEQENTTLVQFMGVEVQWPPDCSEEMLKQIISFLNDATEKNGMEDPQEVSNLIFYIKN